MRAGGPAASPRHPRGGPPGDGGRRADAAARRPSSRAGALAGVAAAALVGCGAVTPGRPAGPDPYAAEGGEPLPARAAPAAELPAAGPVRLEDVLAAVEAHHPLIAAAQAERAVADGRQLAAQGPFDLALRGRGVWNVDGYYENGWADAVLEQRTPLWGASFFGGYRFSDGDFPVYDGKLVTNRGGEVRAGVRLPLLRGGPTDEPRTALAQAERDQDAAAATLERQRIELARRAASDYWAWVAAGRRLEVADALLRLAEARAAAVAEAVAAGDLPPIEADDNRRLVAQRRAIQAGARRGLEKAAIDLSLSARDAQGRPVLLGRERLPAGWPAPSGPDGRDRDALVLRALEARPELRRVAALTERARLELDLAENQGLPALDVLAAASQDVRDVPFTTREELELELGFVLDVPLERRQAKGRARAARALLAALDGEARFARDRVAADVQDALSALEAARDRAREARAALAAARDLEAAERAAFDLGQSTLLVVNLREQAAADAAALEVDALADVQRALADLKAAVGLWRVEDRP